jgi:acetolactate decarboxylase
MVALKQGVFISAVAIILSQFILTDAFGQIQEVRISGAMKNVMMKGQLKATIHLDTVQNKQHLYGIGPVENLQGEIMVYDGVAYKAIANAGESMKVEKGFNLKAPFFVYANIDHWTECRLPDSVKSLSQLDQYLTIISADKVRPFAFKLEGKIGEAEIHLVNLPANTNVNSPEDAHQGKRNFKLQNENAKMIGFFSTQHKGIFTHHDSNIHVHLITVDEKAMGHLDAISLNSKSVKLYLSE